jgi:hypothetical protein
MATVAAEITKQAGSAANFSKMNRLQQEAMASAVGMSADGLADMLVEQEALKSIGRSLNEEEQKAYQAAVDKYGVDEAAKMLKDGELENMLQQQSTSEKFAQTIEQLKETFISIIDGPLGSMLDMINKILSNSFSLKATFAGIALIIGGIKLTGFISQLITALATSGALAATSAATASAVTLGVGAIAVVAGLASIMAGIYSATNQAKQIKDGAIDPKGGLIVSGEKGSIQLDPKDSIIAGTDLVPKGMDDGAIDSKGKIVASGAKGSIGGGDMSAVISAINALANRPINVSIDGKKVIEATTGAQPNTQGEENRKNSYKMS